MSSREEILLQQRCHPAASLSPGWEHMREAVNA